MQSVEMSKSEQEINVVSGGIKNTVWGKILWNSSVYFNSLLAENWLKYCDSYSDFDMKKDKNAITLENYKRQRKNIVDVGNLLKTEIRKLSFESTRVYSDYIKLEPPQELVSIARQYELAKIEGNHEAVESLSKGAEEYCRIIGERKEKENLYQSVRNHKGELELKHSRFINKNREKTKRLASKIRALDKIVKKCEITKAKNITEDRDELYRFFKSDALAERLLITVHSILKRINNFSFRTGFSNTEKEQVAEQYFNLLIKSSFNFDYIIACYRENNGTLERIPNEELVKTIYNGYFLTLKGSMAKAFFSVYNERNNKQSFDDRQILDDGNEGDNLNWLSNPENRNRNKGWKNGNSFKPKMILDQYVVDDSLKSFWNHVSNHLLDNIDAMAADLFSVYRGRYSEGFYIKEKEKGMKTILVKVIQKINIELMAGKVLGVKLNHIIVDSVGGMENRTEKMFFINSITTTIKTYMCKYFAENLGNIVGSEVDMLFSEGKTKELYNTITDRLGTRK